MLIKPQPWKTNFAPRPASIRNMDTWTDMPCLLLCTACVSRSVSPCNSLPQSRSRNLRKLQSVCIILCTSWTHHYDALHLTSSFCCQWSRLCRWCNNSQSIDIALLASYTDTEASRVAMCSSTAHAKCYRDDISDRHHIMFPSRFTHFVLCKTEKKKLEWGKTGYVAMGFKCLLEL